MKEKTVNEMLEFLDFPEEIFKGLHPDTQAFAKKHWSGSPEKFIENMEKTMGISTSCELDEKGKMTGRVLVKKVTP